MYCNLRVAKHGLQEYMAGLIQNRKVVPLTYRILKEHSVKIVHNTQPPNVVKPESSSVRYIHYTSQIQCGRDNRLKPDLTHM